MLLEMFVVVGSYRVFRSLRRRGRSGSRNARPIKRSSDEAGAAGEAAADAKLRTTLRWLCGDDFYLHEGPLVIEHAPGTAFPTAEIDHLAVTPFGIFIFETKNWSGRIAPTESADVVLRTSPSGATERRRSPAAQTRRKLRFMRQLLPHAWQVHAAAIFASPETSLDARLPADFLTLEDLPQWLRAKREAFGDAEAIDVRRAKSATLMFADSSKAALAAHKRRVQASAPQKSEFSAVHKRSTRYLLPLYD